MRICVTLKLVAGLLLTLPASAQWTGAIKIGSSYTDFSGNLSGGATTWERVLGLSASVAFDYEITDGLSAVFELMYLRTGAKTNVKYLDVPAALTSKIAYLTVPVLLQYQFDTGKYMYPRIFAGPSGLFKLDALLSISTRPNDELLFEDDQSIGTLDYGLMAGAALDFEVADQLLTLELRYYRGLGDVTKPSQEIDDSVLHNQGWVMLMGVWF